jgi:hypothetical protein
VVSDQHDRAGRHIRLERARSIGQDQFFDAESGQRLKYRPHDRSIAMLVVVRPAGEQQHRPPGQCSSHDLAGMSGDAARRETGQIGVGDAHRVLDLAGQRSQAGAEHDGDVRC